MWYYKPFIYSLQLENNVPFVDLRFSRVFLHINFVGETTLYG